MIDNYTCEDGRQIYRNGQPFISIGREGITYPAHADRLAHFVAKLLQESQPDPDNLPKGY